VVALVASSEATTLVATSMASSLTTSVAVVATARLVLLLLLTISLLGILVTLLVLRVVLWHEVSYEGIEELLGLAFILALLLLFHLSLRLPHLN
jgi:hypothetical protein